MKRRKRDDGPHEPPSWYRTYDPAAWDEPDGHEQAMMAGNAGYRCWPDAPDSAWPGWPQFIHDQHARRRWQEAKYAYRRAHPDLATQEFEALIARHRFSSS